MSGLALVPDDPGEFYVPADEDGDPILLVQKRRQLFDAIERMDMDTSGCPTLGFPDLVDVTGPMLPGQLWTVIARPENGKTTFCLNAGYKWVSGIRPFGFAYFGTEEGPDTQQLRFAAVMTGLPSAEVVACEWDKIGGKQAHREILEAVKEIHGGRFRDLVFFAEETRPKMVDVRRAADDAVRLGLPILMLDHFHRMAMAESQNEVATLAETVRQIKQLAVQTGLVILMAAQARRAPEGSILRYLPPGQDQGKGTSALEEEADVMLGLFRPLARPDGKPLSRADILAFERGEINQADVLQPNTMGVKVLKHRRNGDMSGKVIKLHCERGMLANHSGLRP